jgi:hypothetical protein
MARKGILFYPFNPDIICLGKFNKYGGRTMTKDEQNCLADLFPNSIYCSKVIFENCPKVIYGLFVPNENLEEALELLPDSHSQTTLIY